MPVTNDGRNKLTRGRPALQPRNKEKILAKGYIFGTHAKDLSKKSVFPCQKVSLSCQRGAERHNTFLS